MWIISKRRLREYWRTHPDTKSWLDNWYRIARGSRWTSLENVRRTFPHADVVKVGSGKSATVFNVCGNKHRMITAIHYNTSRLFVLELMPHAEYGRNQWKERL